MVAHREFNLPTVAAPRISEHTIPPMTLAAGVGGQSPEPGGAIWDRGLDLVHAIRLVRRRWGLAALVTMTGVVLVVNLVLSMPRNYRAEAILILDPRRSKISDLQAPTDALLSRTQADLSAIRTEAEMIMAPTVLREVVLRLGLADIHNEPSAFRVRLYDVRDQLTAWLASVFPRLKPGVTLAAPDVSQDGRIDLAADALARDVTVVNEGGSYALRVQATAKDADLAARIANSVAEAYLESQRRRQTSEGDAEINWLQSRLEDLRRVVQESDAAVERYRASNRLGQGSSTSTLDAQINEVNSALTAEKTRLSGAVAVLDEAQNSVRHDRSQSVPAVLASPSIQELVAQEAILEARRGELQRGLGPRHPAILDLEGQLSGLRGRMAGEVAHIIAGLQSDVTAGERTVSDLTQRLRELEVQREAMAAATVELAELERRTDANRQIYTQVLNQLSASLVRRAPAGSTEVRLVSAARPPPLSSGPSRALPIAGGAVASCALGVLAALLSGYWRGGFGGARPLQQATGLATLELLPQLNRRELRRLWRAPEGSAADIPIRSLAFMLKSVCRQVGPRCGVLLITSSVRGEGKSLLASQLARALATLDARVLLVDLDFWRPAVASAARLLNAVPTGLEIDGTPIMRDPASGLELLPVEARTKDMSSAAAFARRLRAVCAPDQDYELVILDAPPILPVPDVLAAAALADATLLMVRFEHTRAEAVRAAQLRLASVGVRPLGTVLTRVVRRKYRSYGYREAGLTQSLR